MLLDRVPLPIMNQSSVTLSSKPIDFRQILPVCGYIGV